jgi:hypothetical protein
MREVKKVGAVREPPLRCLHIKPSSRIHPYESRADEMSSGRRFEESYGKYIASIYQTTIHTTLFTYVNHKQRLKYPGYKPDGFYRLSRRRFLDRGASVRHFRQPESDQRGENQTLE